MTPAQEAKEYAAAHGFTITPNGRRYDVHHGVALIANVGSYTAALNAMLKQAAIPVMPQHEPKTPDTVTNEQGVELHAYAAGIIDSTPKTAAEIALSAPGDAFVRMHAKTDHVSIDDYFENATTAAKQRIRERAAQLRNPRPWRIVHPEFGVNLDGGYATRADALKVVRRGFSAPGELGRFWRTSGCYIKQVLV